MDHHNHHNYLNCPNCPNCKIMKKKIMVYEKFFAEMKKIEDEELLNNPQITDSIIIEKDYNGITNKKIPSDLTESFLIIDKGKDLRHLSRKEQNIINEQDNLHNYNEIKKQVGIIGTVMSYTISFGKWLAII